MEGTLIASEVAKCENLPLLDQFKDELDKQSFNTFDSEGIGPVRVANTLTRLSLMSNPSVSNPPEGSGREYFHSVLLGGLLSQSKVLAGAAIVLWQGGEEVANPNNTRHIYVYPKENNYVTMDTVSEQRRSLYTAMLQQYLNNNNNNNNINNNNNNNNNKSFPTKPSPADGYGNPENQNRIQYKSVNFQAGSWSHIYFDCNLTKSWLLSYAAPYLDSKGAYSGIVVVDIDLTKVEINQCARDGTLFSNSHKCRLETTQCIAVPVAGKFKRGSYRCQCKPGYYFPMINASHSYFNGTLVENQLLEWLRNGSGHSDHFLDSFQCLPCRKGCPNCVDDQPCFVEYNILFRGIPLGIQSFCMTITIVLGLVVFRLRKTKVIGSSFWAMLELLLIGSLLLYSTVVIRYFEPTTLTCLLVPWFREVGFTIVYGVLLLKMYRLLSDFQSRKAHRVHVQDKDLLKYLLLMVIVVLGYMAAWTAVNLDHANDNVPLVTSGVTVPDGLKYFVCRAHWWDYVIEILEVLFLIFGIYLCYCVRSAPSDYGEGRYITIAICNETLISTVLYFARHGLWLTLDPDYLFLMYFMRCQLTVTVTLILLLGPKLWYVHRPPDEEHIRQRAYSQSDVHDSIAQETMKLNIGISSNGDVDVGEINLADMDPEDIRAELRRLYTQLQIYKTKTMRKDNPHISKRRGGRKQTHRRFSLQAFHHKHRHHHDHDHDHEISKTPEESTNSAEAVAISMETSGKTGDDSHDSRPGPSVSFKSAHK
ncbi:probable G-protein coupled receptor 158 [Argonauta hians]